jgi:CheY-like chemotaxis protein
MPPFSALIIEDDPMQRALLNLMLTPISTQVTAFGSSEEALPFLQSEVPAVILLDIVLPGMDGIQILHHIRADQRFESTKIFLITAVPNRVTSTERALVDRVIDKPFLVTQIRRAIREVLPADNSAN